MKMNESVILEEQNTAGLLYYWSQYWYEIGDKRTHHFPLVRDGPWLMFIVMSCYLVFVKKLGPLLMRSREPFELRYIMLPYNTFMVVVNAFFFVQSLEWLKYGSSLIDFRFPSKEEMSPSIERHIWTFYLYYITKFIDLLDTVFFVLRKKDSQVTPLHIYHHTAVPILGWLTFWYRYNVPSISLFALLNSFVHVVMYSYYTLAAFGPNIQKHLWWKKYITQLQLIQFAIFGIYGSLVKLFHTGYPPFAFWLAFSQPPLFFYMFYDFYLRSYQQSNKKKSKCS